MGLGERLKAARDRLGLRPVDAAKKIGVSGATYSRWESGEDFPRGRNLQAIHEVLGVPLSELVAAGRTPQAPDATAARASQGSSVRSTPYTPTEADMEQLGSLWTRLVDIVKTRDGIGRKDWEHIKFIVERSEVPAVGDIPNAASGKKRR